MNEQLQYGVEMTVKSFCLSIILNERWWNIEARKNHKTDFRFAGKLKQDDKAYAFVMVRSATGRWIISGDNLPVELQNHAQEIGKAMRKGLENPGNNY